MEKKQRGRQAGSVKSITTIKDPILGKYYIEIEQDSFNVCEEGKQSPLAFCSSLPNALKNISKRLIVDKEITLTIKGYINELNQVFNQLTTITTL
jgi:hypothetical protein